MNNNKIKLNIYDHNVIVLVLNIYLEILYI